MSKYKVGDKVVLTVSDVNEKAYYSYYVFNNNDLILWEPSTDKYAEPLSTYTEPLEAKIRRQAAEITRLLAENEKLKAENGNVIWEIEQAFDRGCNAAWELARKIFDMETNDIEDIFITEDAWNLGNVLNNYTYTEAAAKVADWEKVKEFKVGDILEDRDEGNKVIVTSLKGRVICLLWDDGRIGTTYIELAKGIFRNTGRHIDIGSFLKQIGGERNE